MSLLKKIKETGVVNRIRKAYKSFRIWFHNLWLFWMYRRFRMATSYYNFRYIQVLRWCFQSREDTNVTYDLREDNLAYLAEMLSVVTGKSPGFIQSLMEEAQEDEVLKQDILSAIGNAKGRRITDKEVRFGRRLGWYALVRILKPKIVVETGVDKGLGSVLLCSALLKNKAEGNEGHYYGTDIYIHAGFLLTEKYKTTGEILYGDSIKSLKGLKETIGIFINDSDHSEEYEYNEYKTIQALMSDETVLLGDNSHCSDRLQKFSRETGRKFLYFEEKPKNHWYPGAGIGISYTDKIYNP